MPINFPTTPANNTVYTYNSRSWIYSSTTGRWTAYAAGQGAAEAAAAQAAASASAAAGSAAIFLHSYLR